MYKEAGSNRTLGQERVFCLCFIKTESARHIPHSSELHQCLVFQRHTVQIPSALREIRFLSHSAVFLFVLPFHTIKYTYMSNSINRVVTLRTM